jgi:hypothetical protein
VAAAVLLDLDVAASRVVPGISLTMTRSSPASAFTKVDLPTFRFPITAIRRPRVGIGAGGIIVASLSLRSEIFRMWAAATPKVSPKPSSKNSVSPFSMPKLSTLLATRMTFLSRNRAAISWSSRVQPAWTSTRKTTISASAMAFSIWRSTSS